MARCLIAAGRVDRTESALPSSPAVSDGSKNGESPTVRSSAAEVVHQLSADLSEVIKQLYEQYGTQELPQVIIVNLKALTFSL